MGAAMKLDPEAVKEDIIIMGGNFLKRRERFTEGEGM